VQIGGNNVVFSPAYGSPFVMDLDRGRRYGTLEDFQNFIKLAYGCPWLHHSGGTVCEPTDVPVNKRHLDMVYAHMRYSDKAYMGSITSEQRAEDSIEMSRASCLAPSSWTSNCVILGNVNVNSPLLWDGTMTKSARAYARANQAAGDRALHPGRRHGAGDQCRRHRPGPCRNHGRLRHRRSWSAPARR